MIHPILRWVEKIQGLNPCLAVFFYLVCSGRLKSYLLDNANFDDMNQDLAIANDALVSSVGQLEGFLQQPFKPYLCCCLKQITVHFPTHKATCQSMGHIHTAKLFSSKKILGSYNLPCGDSLCGLWSPLATTRHALGECWLAEANTASRSMNDHS